MRTLVKRGPILAGICLIVVFGIGVATERFYQHFWVNNVGELLVKRTDSKIQLTIDGTHFTQWNAPVTLAAGSHRFVANVGPLQLETTFRVKRGDKAMFHNIVSYQFGNDQLQVFRDSQLEGIVPKPDPEVCEIRTASGGHWFMTDGGTIGQRDCATQDGREQFTLHWIRPDLREAFIESSDGRFVTHRSNTPEMPRGYLALCKEGEPPTLFAFSDLPDKTSWVKVAYRKYFVDSNADPTQPRTTQYDVHASPHCFVRVKDQQNHVTEKPPTPAIQTAANSRSIRRFKGHTGAISGALFTPDGRHIITGSADGTIRFWDVATGKQIGKIEAHRPVLSLAISGDGNTLAGGLADAVVKIWTLQHVPELVHKDERILARDSRGEIRSVAFSPDGTQLAAGGNSQEHTRIWNLLEPEQRCKSSSLVGPVDSIAWSLSGETLMGCVDSGQLYRWVVNSQPSFSRFGSQLNGRLLIPSNDGPLVLSMGEVLDAQTNQLKHKYQQLRGVWPVSGQLSTNRSILVTADVIINKIEQHEREPDELVTVWDLSSGDPLAIMRDRFGQVGNIAISPSGCQIAYGSGKRKTNALYEVVSTGDYDLRVWDISDDLK